MTPVGLAERLQEMNDSPEDTSLFEIEDLLSDLGYKVVYSDADVVMYRHPKTGASFDFNRRFADGVPISIVRRVATTCLKNL